MIEPLHLRVYQDSTLLERDEWRVDAMWKLMWMSLLDSVTIQQDKEIIRIAELEGKEFTATLLTNPRLIRYFK